MDAFNIELPTLGADSAQLSEQSNCGITDDNGVARLILEFVAGTDGADDAFISGWEGMTVVENGFMNYTITAKDGTVTHHGGSLYYPGDSDGRNSMFKGACNEVCHNMFGGFNPSCFGSVLLETGCWSGLSPMSGFNSDGLGRNTMIAMGAMTYPAAASSDFVVVDGFGEGCLGGAGRIPKTFDPPTGVVAAPKNALAGPIVPPWFGWFACACPRRSPSCWKATRWLRVLP